MFNFLQIEDDYKRKNNDFSAERFCKIVVPEFLKVLSIPVICCCHKAAIWDTWFGGSFIANESNEFVSFSLPENASILLNSFYILADKLASTVGIKGNRKTEDVLSSFLLPHP